MTKRLMNHTLAAAGFAAILLTGACATNDKVTNGTTDNGDLVHVTQSGTVTPVPGPALVDSDGNVYSSSATGSGNASSIGTNTNVNNVPQPGTVQITEVTTTPLVEPEPMITTTTVETTEVPMTSSTEEVTDEPAPVRERLRKD